MNQRSLKGGDESLATMGPLEGDDAREFRGQLRRAGRGGGPHERLGHGAKVEEGELGSRPRPQGPGGLPRRATIVGVVEGELAGSHETMAGDLGVAMTDDELGTLEVEPHTLADERTWHAVARGAEADRACVSAW